MIAKLQSKPHFTISAEDMAAWIDDQPTIWWFVVGDPTLTSRVDFPCPGDELSSMLRQIGRNILVYDKSPTSQAHGELIDANRLDSLADIDTPKAERTFLLAWQGDDAEWILCEDKDATDSPI